MTKDTALKGIIIDLLGIDVMTVSRKREIVDARKIYSHILYNNGYGLTKIARTLRKNHATVLHYIRDAEVLVLMDKMYKNNHENITYAFEMRCEGIETESLSRTELELEVDRLRTENEHLKNSIRKLLMQTK